MEGRKSCSLYTWKEIQISSDYLEGNSFIPGMSFYSGCPMHGSHPEIVHTNKKNWLSRVVYIFVHIHIYVIIIKRKSLPV